MEYCTRFREEQKQKQNLTEEQYQSIASRIKKECDIHCRLEQVHECCAIFRDKFYQLVNNYDK